MLRQLISKWGVMSIDLQTAINNDMAVTYGDGSVEYVDNSADFTHGITDAPSSAEPLEAPRADNSADIKRPATVNKGREATSQAGGNGRQVSLNDL
jgi:recombinational DNA repair protein RecT